MPEIEEKIPELLKTAKEFVNQKEFDKADKLYERVLFIDSNNIEACYQMGIIYVQRNDLDKALIKFRTILNKDTQNIPALLQLGNIYELQGKLDNALILYQKIYKQIPNEPIVIEMLADIYVKKSMTLEAEKQYKFLGKLFIEKNENEKAIQIYIKLNKLIPNQIEIIKQLIALSEKLNLEEDIVENKIHLAQLYEIEGLSKKAYEIYDAIFKKHPEHHFVKEKLYKSDSSTPILEKADELLEDMDNHIENFIEKEKQKEKEEKEILSQKTKIQESIAEAEIYIQHGLLNNALEEYEKIIVLNPERIDIYYKIASLYEKKKLFEKAYNAYKKILGIDNTQEISQKKVDRFEKGESLIIEQAQVQEQVNEEIKEEEILEKEQDFQEIVKIKKKKISYF
ncbi:MAG: tetratricopeptide repeat protein [bacterium]